MLIKKSTQTHVAVIEITRFGYFDRQINTSEKSRFGANFVGNATIGEQNFGTLKRQKQFLSPQKVIPVGI